MFFTNLFQGKICSKCGEYKGLDKFSTSKTNVDGKRSYCNACGVKDYQRWANKNKEHVAKYAKLRRKLYPEKIRAWDNSWRKRKRLSDPNFKVLENLRNRIKNAVKNKSECTIDLLGCSIEDFRKHLELKFYGDMSWDNYGKKWHIDHIKPCCAFDLSNPIQQKECFGYLNCQPLLIKDNLDKISQDIKMSRNRASNSILV